MPPDLDGTVPISLAAGDFNADGVPDLLVGHSGVDGYRLTLHPGNLDSIFPRGSSAPANTPFLPPVSIADVEDRPDLIAAG